MVATLMHKLRISPDGGNCVYELVRRVSELIDDHRAIADREVVRDLATEEGVRPQFVVDGAAIVDLFHSVELRHIPWIESPSMSVVARGLEENEPYLRVALQNYRVARHREIHNDGFADVWRVEHGYHIIDPKSPILVQRSIDQTTAAIAAKMVERKKG